MTMDVCRTVMLELFPPLAAHRTHRTAPHRSLQGSAASNDVE